MASVVAFFVVLFSSEVWLSIGGFFALFKLVTTFSIGSAWGAFLSVPYWIWDFVISALS